MVNITHLHKRLAELGMNPREHTEYSPPNYYSDDHQIFIDAPADHYFKTDDGHVISAYGYTKTAMVEDALRELSHGMGKCTDADHYCGGEAPKPAANPNIGQQFQQ